MNKKIIISVAVGILGILAYFTYVVIDNRYLEEDKEYATQDTQSGTSIESSQKTAIEDGVPITPGNPAMPENEDVALPPSEEIIEDSISDSIKKNTGATNNIKANITKTHCDDACKAFASDLVLFAYCEQVCGISPIKDVSDCGGKKDLEKDYCQKDLAITKTDASLCESIKDDNIRQTCKNRIAEDAVEKMQSENDPAL